MSQESILKHSLIFEIDGVQKNTYDDWLFVPTKRPTVIPPNVKTNFVDLPGANGFLDLTEALTNEPAYGPRQSNWEFMIETRGRAANWATIYSDVLNFLHGKQGKVYLEDDPDWYYEGRFSVEPWTSEESWSTIAISYVLKPFKKNNRTGVTSL